MSYEFWARAERFYTFTIPYFFVSFLLGLIVLLFIFMYAGHKKNVLKITAIVYSLFLVSTIGYFFYGHSEYNQWVQQSSIITPGVRSHNYIFGFKNEEDDQLVRLYQESAELGEVLGQLNMYEGEYIKEDFDYTYLTSDRERHFFEFGDQNVFDIRTEIEYTSSSSYIEGIRYRLIDDRFEDIGFYNDHAIIFTRLVLNETEVEEMQEEIPVQSLNINDMYNDWNFGGQQ